jgi:hypothetical protein
MDTRTILIIAALAAPLAGLAVLAQNATPTPKNNTAKTDDLSTSVATPERGKAKAPQKPFANAPQSLDEAKKRLRQRLADLEKMTPEEWEAEQKEREKALRKMKRAAWENLNPDQKLKRMGAPKREPRLPDLGPVTADPKNPEFDKAPAAGE